MDWSVSPLAGLALIALARYARLNRKDQSRYPCRIKAIEFPMSEQLKGKVKMASATEFWAMRIPANARGKQLAWSFIRAMSAPTATLGEARNGNGPVRFSTYRDASFATAQPLAAIEAKALQNARVPLPAFPQAVRAQAIFLEEVQQAVPGRKTPQDAVAAITKRVQPLLPA